MLRYIWARRCERYAGLLVLLFSAVICEAQAENWTRFRGPNGSGVATDHTFPATWSDEDYLWKVRLPGVGHASPVGWENQLFITTGDSASGESTLVALDATTGEELWQQEFAGETYQMHAQNSYASATPVVDEQRVYITWAAGGKVHCMALTHQGKQIWQVELGRFAEAHGFAASPVVVAGVVCVQLDETDRGYFVGLDAVSGDVRWRVERPAGKASYATACSITLPEERQAVISQSMSGGMQAIDVQTGEVVWEDADAFPARCVSSPIVAEGMILGVCGGGGSGKLLVGMDFAGQAESQSERLKLTKQIPYVPTPLLVDGRLFLWHDQGKVSMADLRGDSLPTRVSWTERIGGKFFGSPILAGDKVYCLSMDGRAIVISADDEFKLLGENDLGEPSSATPAVHQGRLYLRTESTLACLAAEQ